MVRYSYENNAASTLNGAISDSDLTIVVSDGSVFPAANFKIKIGDEMILVTSRSTNTFTVTSGDRGYDGTTAAAASDSAPVELAISAEEFESRIIGYPIVEPTDEDHGAVIRYNKDTPGFDFTSLAANPTGRGVHLTASQNVAGYPTAAVNVSWDAEVRDDAGFWDSGTPEDVIAQATGWHSVDANIYGQASVGMGDLIWDIYINDVAASMGIRAADSEYQPRRQISGHIYLTKGDVVNLNGYHDVSSTFAYTFVFRMVEMFPSGHVGTGQKIYGISKRKNGHAQDDDFDDGVLDPAWTVVEDTSPNITVNEGESKGVHIYHPGGDAASELHALMKAYAPAGDFCIEIGAEFSGIQTNNPVIGLIAANGNTYGAGQQHISLAFAGSASFQMADNLLPVRVSDFSNYSVEDAAGTNVNYWIPQGRVYLRFSFKSSTNTWTALWSQDGVNWIANTNTQVQAITVSHIGFYVSTWNGADPQQFKITHFYVYDTEKTAGADTSVELWPIGHDAIDDAMRIPRDSWLDLLFRRPSDETVHAQDDEFDDASLDADWTTLTVTGGQTITEKRHRLNVAITSAIDQGDANGIYKAYTPSLGEAIEVCFTGILADDTVDANWSSPIIGLMFSDGVTATDDCAGLACQAASETFPGEIYVYPVDGSATLTAVGLTSGDGFRFYAADKFYVRLEYDAANTFKASISTDGVYWYVVDAAISRTLSPTYLGIWWNSGSSTPAPNSFAVEYLRVVTV